MWPCLVSVRCVIVGFWWGFMMLCKSRIVLCIPLVLKVTECMGGGRYSIVSGDSSCVFGYCGGSGSFVACWVWVPRVRFQFLYCSSVVCLYLNVFIGVCRWGMTLGIGKAMLMQGGACATDLRLMGVRFCSACLCGWEVVGGLLGGFVFPFRCVLFLILVLVDLRLYGFGASSVWSDGKGFVRVHLVCMFGGEWDLIWWELVGIPSVLGSTWVSCLPISLGGVYWVLGCFALGVVFYDFVYPGDSYSVITYRRCMIESWSACLWLY